MKLAATCLGAASLMAVFVPNVRAALIENFQYNDAPGTSLPSTSNTGTSPSSFTSAPNVTTTGTALRFTQGADVFRSSTGASIPRNLSSGIVTMTISFSDASINGGDTAGASVGFGLRDSGSNLDLFQIRLQRQNSELRLQSRVVDSMSAVGTNTDLLDLNATALPTPPSGPKEFTVTAVLNLATDKLDVSWTLNGAAGSFPTITLPAANNALEFDQLRLAASTNSADWGAADYVDVDYLTVDYVVPEPASVSLLGLASLAIGRRRRSFAMSA
jgi:hypothetical protein